MRICLYDNDYMVRPMKLKLIQIYECLCDETRLRILNLLNITPLCVSHIQKILEINQVKVSKHLMYMKERQMLHASRCENRTLYALSKETSRELENNMRCLQDCTKEYPVFLEDINRLKSIDQEVNQVKKKYEILSQR